jgi:predicted SAM-dependent methyltransferase
MLYKIKLALSLLIKKLIEKYFKHYLWPKSLHSRNYNFGDLYTSDDVEKVTRANIGAGPYFKLNGWVSADFLPNFKTNNKNIIHIDLLENPDFLPFENLEALYTSHTLEHFNIIIVKRLIKSMFNSLKEGGYLRIVVPDASLIIDRVRNNDIDYFTFFNSYFKNFSNYEINITDHALHALSDKRCRFSRNTFEDKAIEYQKFNDMIYNSNIEENEIIDYLNNHNFKQDEVGTYHLSCFNSYLLISLLKEVGFKIVYKSAFMQSKYNPMRQVPVFDGTHPWFSLYVEAIK